MQMKKKIGTLMMSVMLAATALGGALAAPVGTLDMPQLIQQHPGFTKAMASWKTDVTKGQEGFQNEIKKDKITDQKQQQDVAKKYADQLNKQRLDLFLPIEKDILAKADAVRKEKGLDNVVLKGSVLIGQYQDITADVAAKMK